MNEQTNPHTEFAAMTDEELEQVAGGQWIPGKRLTSYMYQKVCMATHCEDAVKTLTTLRICKDCPYKS